MLPRPSRGGHRGWLRSAGARRIARRRDRCARRAGWRSEVAGLRHFIHTRTRNRGGDPPRADAVLEVVIDAMMTTRRSWQDVMVRAAGLLSFALALVIFTASVVRPPLLEGNRLDIQPSPDGEEYFAGAVSLHREGAFFVEVAGHKLPPRYPFGFSLVMVPWLAAGFTPVTVPFLANGAIGLGLIVGIFAVFWRRRPLAAGVGAVLLASWPSFIVVCRSPLSDLSTGAVVLLAFWALVRFASGGPLSIGAAGAALLGVAVWFRLASLLLAPILLLAPLCLEGAGRRRARAAVVLSVAFVLGMAPFLWFNYENLGHPLRTGYSLWVPTMANPLYSFQPARLMSALTNWWWDMRGAGRRSFSTADLYGMSSYQSFALIGLMLVTAAAGLRRRAEVAAAAALAASALALGSYLARDARLLFVTLLVAIPFVARESAVLLEGIFDRRAASRLAALVVAAMIGSSIVGIPKQAGRFALERAIDMLPLQGVSVHYMFVQQLDRVAGGQPALVLADFNPAYISAVSP